MQNITTTAATNSDDKTEDMSPLAGGPSDPTRESNSTGDRPEIKRYDLDWVGARERFLDAYEGRVRFARDAEIWHKYDGKRWRQSEDSLQEECIQITGWVKKEAARLDSVADQLTDDEEKKAKRKTATEVRGHARNLTNNVRKISSLASSSRRVSVRMADFDTDRRSLNTPQGVVSLETGELRPHDPALMHRKITTADWVGLEPKPGFWQEYLDVIQPDRATQECLQRLAGVTVLGETKEKLIIFPFGETNTCKTTTLNALMHALGDYAGMTSTDLFLANSREKYGLADLAGLLLACASEFNQDARVNRALLKGLSGGDTLRARYPYGREFSFRPICTTWIATNHLPYFGDDNACWKRLVIVPFNIVPPPGRWEGNIADHLRAASSEILSWIVKGAVLYLQDNELRFTQAMEDLKDSLRADQDNEMVRYIKSSLATGRLVLTEDQNECATFADAIYEDYLTWRNENHIFSEQKSLIAFGKALKSVTGRESRDKKDGRIVKKAWPIVIGDAGGVSSYTACGSAAPPPQPPVDLEGLAEAFMAPRPSPATSSTTPPEPRRPDSPVVGGPTGRTFDFAALLELADTAAETPDTLPIGKYRVRVSYAESGLTLNGQDKITVSLQVVDDFADPDVQPSYIGNSLKETIVVPTRPCQGQAPEKLKKQREIFLKTIAAFRLPTEVLTNAEALADAMRGKEVIVFVKHDTYNDQLRAKVRTWIAAT